MTHYILVDFENVQPDALPPLAETSFTVLVFIGESQKALPRPIVMDMQRREGRAKYIEISGSGSNALDFHIAFYIGQFSVENPAASFSIISKDKGFDPLIRHLQCRGIQVQRHETIASLKMAKAKTPEEKMKLAEASLKKGNRPRTVKRLSNFVNTLFGKTLTQKDIDGYIKALEQQKILEIKGETVTYL